MVTKQPIRFSLLIGVVSLAGCQPSNESGSTSSNTLVLDGCEVQTYQADMLAQVNAARASSRTCGTTHFPATHALTYQCQLDEAAERHSQDMADNNFFSHTGSDGLQVSHRVSATGYNWSAVGENIAAGQSTVDDVMQGWLNSPGHCSNIMSDHFQDFAVSRADNDTADFNHYWTQVFAAPL